MRRYDPDQLQDTRRVLSVYSRYEPFEVVIRWNGGGEYETLGSPADYSAEAQRERLLEALAELGTATTLELAKAVELPHATASKRLSELEAAGQVVRTGTGKRGDPYRWSLADGGGDPDDDDFVSPRNTHKRGETKTDGETDFSHREAKIGGHGSVDFVSPRNSLIRGETKTDGKPENPHQSYEIGGHSPDDQGESSLTLTRSKSVNVNDGVNDDPGKHHTWLRDAKNGEHDPADDQGESSLTLTRYMSVNVNVNDDPGKHHTPHQDAKNGGHDTAVNVNAGPEKHHTPHHEAKNGGHDPAGEDGKHHTPHRDAKNDDPDGDGFFSSRYTPMREEKKTDEKHHTPHREAKIGGHDPGGHASQAVITITHYKASDSDDGDGKHHTPHREAKNGGHGSIVEAGKHHTWRHEAKNEEHTPGGEDEKHHTWLPDAETATCVVCGQLFTWSGRGQPARYCSRTCQMKAYRQRWSSADTPGHGVPVSTAVVQADSGPPDPGICLDCHQPITAEEFQYRCPACLKARYDRLQREYPEKLVRWLQTHDQKEGGR
jgi:DNA-binding transcriptional ArsR family regulator